MTVRNLKRKPKTPRASSTYRGARRNAYLRRGRGVAKRQWPGAPSRYVPVLIKPNGWTTRVDPVTALPIPVQYERKQPEIYRNSARRPGGGRIRRRRPVP